MLIRFIIAEVSLQFDVPVALILSSRGNREQYQARLAAYFLARCFGHSTQKIARVMGRDQSTVCHGAKRALEWAKADLHYCDRLMGAARALWVRDVAWRI